MSNYNGVVPVPPQSIGDVWNYASSYLKRVFDKNRAWGELDGLRKKFEASEAILWLVGEDQQVKGCFSTKLVERGPSTCLRVENLATDIFEETCTHLNTVIHFYEEHVILHSVEVEGREGFKRKLKDLGFSVDTIVGRKLLAPRVLQ